MSGYADLSYQSMWPSELGTVLPFPDPSLESPDGQTGYLEQMLAFNDYENPAPNTTPTGGMHGGREGISPEEFIPDGVLAENYEPAPELDAAANTELISVISDAGSQEFPAFHWENDDQYHGLGVPPGIENLDQPVEYGGTQAIPINPAAEHGWENRAGFGKPALARVARMENHFRDYSAGVKRRMGDTPVEKFEQPLALQTQMYRDMLLVELKRRGVHNVVVSDVPSVPFTDEVLQVDPTVLTPEAPIGPEGVLP